MLGYVFKEFKWQAALLLCGSLAIVLSFILRIWWADYANWPLIIVIAVGSIPLIIQIIIKIYQKDIGADILAAISIIAACILGEYLACVLVILMLAGGQALEAFALGRASSVLKELASRMPSRAQRKRGNVIESIGLSDIKIGDLIIVFPHETSPVDGVVKEGHGFMDESYLTGEPFLVGKAPGTEILSGAVNGDAVLLVEATKLAKDSRYARILSVMAEAEQKRPKLRRLGDQLGAIFAPVSLMIAIGAWIYTSNPLRFLSVLVIATPCPLFIAIPVAIISSISLAARRGIIISEPTVLERLPTCKTAIFDKTGTLTYGRPTLTDVSVAQGFDKDGIVQKVASLEQYSKHPLAKAIMDAAKMANLPLTEATNVSEKPGQGLIGVIDSSCVLVTSRQRILSQHPEFNEILPNASFGLECVIVIDDQYAATMHFHDEPKVDSHRFIRHLGPLHSFEKVMLVSGDRELEVKYLAQQLGIEKALFSQSPEQKLAIVQEEVKKSPTLFMGDGINDAPALKAATVGIAFGEPTAAARKAAGAVIMENTLSKVDELLHLCSNMRKIALQSAIFGMALSFIGMGFASFGFISPAASALLQQIIDALAIMNSLRLTWQHDVKIDL